MSPAAIKSPCNANRDQRTGESGRRFGCLHLLQRAAGGCPCKTIHGLDGPATRPATQADVAEDDADRGALAAQSEVAAPLSRLAARRHDPRWEPGALAAHAGIWGAASNRRPYRDVAESMAYKPHKPRWMLPGESQAYCPGLPLSRHAADPAARRPRAIEYQTHYALPGGSVPTATGLFQ
jgi:hypothetical protein